MTELTLFDLNPPEYAQDRIGRRWWTFHQAHPEVGREFVRLAREWRAANPTKRVGSKAIFEVLRWQTNVGAVPSEGEPFQLDNRYSALYSRWAMSTFPDLRDVFETRRRIAA